MTNKEREQLLRDVCRGLDRSERLDREAQEEAAIIVAGVLGFDAEQALVKLDVAGMTPE